MWWKPMEDDMKVLRDLEKKPAMEAYMRNKFIFLGLQAQPRMEIEKKYFKLGPRDRIDWEFIDYCFAKDYREFQYIAISYLKRKKKLLAYEDKDRIKELIETKSWWDTVDNFNPIVSQLLLAYEEFTRELEAWSLDGNMWVNRSSIIGQLKLKERTDEQLLDLVIRNNLGREEFFINKAIGWALREYGKTRRSFVEDFIRENQDSLSKLSISEASKYL